MDTKNKMNLLYDLLEDLENITSYKELEENLIDDNEINLDLLTCIEFLKEHINNKYIKQSESWNIKKAV